MQFILQGYLHHSSFPSPFSQFHLLDALEFFAGCIASNTTLEKLELRGVPFVGFELTEFIYHSKSLRSLNLSDSTSSITIVADLNRFFEGVALTKTAPLRELCLENMSLGNLSFFVPLAQYSTSFPLQPLFAALILTLSFQLH